HPDVVFVFQYPPPPEFYTLSLHDALPISIEKMVEAVRAARQKVGPDGSVMFDAHSAVPPATVIQFANAVQPYDLLFLEEPAVPGDRKSTRLNSSHLGISYAVFCLKKKNKK